MFYFEPENFPEKWEIVYFVTSRCNNNCNHCWSKNNFLGAETSLMNHEKFFRCIDPSVVKELKFSGGESTLYRELPALISLARCYLPHHIPITVFSNGHFLFEKDGTPKSISSIANQLSNMISSNLNVALHISADEYHIASFAKKLGIDFCVAAQYFSLAIQRVIQVSQENGFEFKVKLHCNIGRIAYHRNKIYVSLDENVWNRYFIKTEGLIKAGNALEIKESSEIQKSDMWSAFVMMGAEFSERKSDMTRDEFSLAGKKIYLNASQNGRGGVIMGWWNLINRNFIGGDVDEFIRFVNERKDY